MTAPTTMQRDFCFTQRHASVALGTERHADVTHESVSMRWGYHPLAGESGAK